MNLLAFIFSVFSVVFFLIFILFLSFALHFDYRDKNPEYDDTRFEMSRTFYIKSIPFGILTVYFALLSFAQSVFTILTELSSK